MKRCWQILTSVKLALALLLLVASFCVAGALVPQNLPQQDYVEIFGESLAGTFHKLGLVHIFGTWTFRVLLFLLAVNLVCCVIRRGRRGWAGLAFVCTHLGIIVVLLGALIRSYWYTSGFLELSAGEASSGFICPDAIRVQLPVTLKLLGFSMERYQAEPTVVVEDIRQDQSRQITVAHYPSCWWDAGKARFRVTGFYPGARLVPALQAAKPGSGVPGVRFSFTSKAGEITGVVLADRGVFRDIYGRLVVMYHQLHKGTSPAEGAERIRAALASQGAYSRAKTTEKLVILAPAQDELELPISAEEDLGREFELSRAGVRVKLLKYLPDFAFDYINSTPYSRSTNPRNPALQLKLSAAGRTWKEWVFAHFSAFGKDGPAPAEGVKTLYLRSGLPAPAEWQVHLLAAGDIPHKAVVAGPDDIPRILDLANQAKVLLGQEVVFAVLDAQGCARLGVEAVPSAFDYDACARIELEGKDFREARWLEAQQVGMSQPLFLRDGHTALTLRYRPGSVKKYLSRVQVIEEDDTLFTADISVNHPLHYREWTFYQSGFNPDIPGTTMLMVSRDRGMWVIYVGFGMLVAGIWFGAYVSPFLKRYSV